MRKMIMSAVFLIVSGLSAVQAKDQQTSKYTSDEIMQTLPQRILTTIHDDPAANFDANN